MLITPDFTDVADSVTAGTYSVRITDAKVDKWEGRDGKPDTPYVNWRMETFGEPEEKNNGRSIFLKTAVIGKGAFRLRDLYKAATKQDLSGGNFDTEQLLGKEVKVTVIDGKDREGNPTGYTEVKAIKPL